MQIPSPRSKRRARIEIIPLIDIMFFLLATFVMVSLSMIKNLGMDVHLPAASTSQAQDLKNYVVITVTATGQYHWNKETLSLTDISSKLQQLKVSNPDTRIFINGDAKTPFENVVVILNEARKFGLAKVAIQTVKQ